jgi:C4-dicarboxylate-specific signal transduction histidine kinase
MEKDWEKLAFEGLAFFGRMSASVSHEIKNVMAVINENAGLVEDLALLVDRGAALDPERLKRTAAAIQKQIRRGDGIVKNMNAFAHSVDEPVRRVSLDETLGLMVALSQRFAATRCVTLSAGEPAGVSVVTNPYFLENCIHLCLAFALDSAGSGKAITAVAESEEDGGRIRFSGIEAPTGPFPSQTALEVARAIDARLEFNQTGKTLVIILPAKIQG